MNIICFTISNIDQHNDIYSKIIGARNIIARSFKGIKTKKFIADCVAL